jgi:hypothetical protein
MERSDDLESEERALSNLMAQEYDNLKLLSAIPEHSDLYQFKLAQYKKVSDIRAKAELVLQDQRVKRLAKNFDLQKRQLERKMHHDAFEEEM